MVQNKNSEEAWLLGNMVISLTSHEHVLNYCCKVRFTYVAESNGVFTWTLLASPLAKFQYIFVGKQLFNSIVLSR